MECLHTHGRRYGCVGFGLIKDQLRGAVGIEMNPVLYADYHLQNKVVNHLSTSSTSPEFDLVKPFVKVCDDKEDFFEIYCEREWRAAANVPINKSTLDCLVVPSRLSESARDLLLSHGFESVRIVNWEDELGALPERDFI